jgi:hypothetical protein
MCADYDYKQCSVTVMSQTVAGSLPLSFCITDTGQLTPFACACKQLQTIVVPRLPCCLLSVTPACLGIGPTAATLCVFDVVSKCGTFIRDMFYSGTSGWSAQLGGVIHNGTCSQGQAIPSTTDIVR